MGRPLVARGGAPAEGQAQPLECVEENVQAPVLGDRILARSLSPTTGAMCCWRLSPGVTLRLRLAPPLATSRRPSGAEDRCSVGRSKVVKSKTGANPVFDFATLRLSTFRLSTPS